MALMLGCVDELSQHDPCRYDMNKRRPTKTMVIRSSEQHRLIEGRHGAVVSRIASPRAVLPPDAPGVNTLPGPVTGTPAGP